MSNGANFHGTDSKFSRNHPRRSSRSRAEQSQFAKREMTGIRKDVVFDFLSRNPNGVYIKDLITQFYTGNHQETKKVLNQVLYDMQGAGTIRRTDSNPPLWQVISGNCLPPPPPLVGGVYLPPPPPLAGPYVVPNVEFQGPTPGNGMTSVKEDLDMKVLNLVKGSPSGLYLKDIMSSLNMRGLAEKKAVNTALYTLKSKKLIKRTVENPPLWTAMASAMAYQPPLPPTSPQPILPSMSQQLLTEEKQMSSDNDNSMIAESGPFTAPANAQPSLGLAKSNGDNVNKISEELAILSCDIAGWFTTEHRKDGATFETIWEHFNNNSEFPIYQRQVVHILDNWEKLGLASKDADSKLWNMSHHGFFAYSSSLKTVHNYVFLVVFFTMGNGDVKKTDLGTIEADMSMYGFETVKKEALDNAVEFLLEVKWIRKADEDDGDVIKYELDAEGVVMFDRFSAEGKFRSLPMRKPRVNLKEMVSEERLFGKVLKLIDARVENDDGGADIDEVFVELQNDSSNSNFSSFDVTQALYSLKQHGFVDKRVSAPTEGDNNSTTNDWFSLKRNLDELTGDDVTIANESSTNGSSNLPSTSDDREKDIVSLVHTTLSQHAPNSYSSVAVRAVINQFSGKTVSMEEVEKALVLLQQFGAIEKKSENPDKWGCMQQEVVVHPAPMPPPTAPFSSQTGGSGREMDQIRQNISRLKNLQALLDKCKSCPTRISALNEYAQVNGYTVAYEQTTQGPDHNRKFECRLRIGSINLCLGVGQSKKEAKSRAADRTCQLVEEIVTSSSGAPPPASLMMSPQPSLPPSLPSSAPQTPVNSVPSSPASSIASTPSGKPVVPPGKNPISELYEIEQQRNLPLHADFKTIGETQSTRKFVCTFYAGGKPLGSFAAQNKKDAKIGAAMESLIVVKKDMPPTPPPLVSSTSNIKSLNVSDSPSVTRAANDPLLETVANLVTCKFDELMAGSQQQITGRKIYAGFVMARKQDPNVTDSKTEYSVVSIGSGNRCISGDRLSMDGKIVHDSHAEVISRRGLMRFFYRQIEAYFVDPSKSIFIRENSSQKLRLRAGIKFHLYISTAPCGDGALFAHSELRDPNAGGSGRFHKPIIDNKKQGVLRTKVENGEGCIPIEADHNVPTWDGLLRGERLRTMSCSDKVMKWNILGLQGSLLSLMIDPVYMSSLSLGSLYHHGHLSRAVCCRLDHFITDQSKAKIPTRFVINHPKIGRVSAAEPNREARKTKTREFSCNWVVGDSICEILDGTKGSLMSAYEFRTISVVSPFSLYNHFKQICHRFNIRPCASYSDTKAQAQDYNQVKCLLIRDFEARECGKWMHKPEEVSHFA